MPNGFASKPVSAMRLFFVKISQGGDIDRTPAVYDVVIVFRRDILLPNLHGRSLFMGMELDGNR